LSNKYVSIKERTQTIDNCTLYGYTGSAHASSVDVVKDCQTVFNFRRVPELVLDRKRKFLQKLCSSDNIICETLAFMAKDELSSLS